MIGDPGIGKTAIVEGLAQQCRRRCSDTLKDKRMFALDSAR